MRERCAVDGCDKPAKHKRTFALNGEEWGWGEIPIDLHMCCEHLDQWETEEVEPCIDLYIGARVRA